MRTQEISLRRVLKQDGATLTGGDMKPGPLLLRATLVAALLMLGTPGSADEKGHERQVGHEGHARLGTVTTSMPWTPSSGTTTSSTIAPVPRRWRPRWSR